MHFYCLFNIRFRTSPDDEFPFYLKEIDRMQTDDKTTVYVDFRHVQSFSAELADIILKNYYRCVLANVSFVTSTG